MTSKLALFLKQQQGEVATQKIVATSLFKDENGKGLAWEVRPLNIKQRNELREKSTLNGELNMDKFAHEFAVLATVHPDLTNKELQDSYGVLGASELLYNLLPISGEYARYIDFCYEVSGFGKSDKELFDDAKN